jgi:hypothetical protein
MPRLLRNKDLLVVCAILTIISLAKGQTTANVNGSMRVASTQQASDHEDVDLSMYQRIRDEGIQHSHIMEYAPN